jgi:hypothetical protein
MFLLLFIASHICKNCSLFFKQELQDFAFNIKVVHISFGDLSQTVGWEPWWLVLVSYYV